MPFGEINIQFGNAQEPCHMLYIRHVDLEEKNVTRKCLGSYTQQKII